jgi:hypothetical protein
MDVLTNLNAAFRSLRSVTYLPGMQRVDQDATGATIGMRAMRLGRTAGRA